MKTLKLDYSTISAWKLCPQKAIYQYINNLKSSGLGGGTSEALEFGQLIHLGLELFGKAALTREQTSSKEALHQTAEALGSGQAPDAASVEPIDLKILHLLAAEASKYGISKLLPDQRRSLAHLLHLMSAYMLHYAGDNLVFIDFEQRSEQLLGSLSDGTKLIYGGTLDALTPDAVFETKTTSYISSGFLDRMNPNDQASGYAFLSGREKIIFNGISTSGYGKSKDAKTSNPKLWTLFKEPSKLFLRSETRRSAEQLAEWRTEVFAVAEEILSYLKTGQLAKRYGSRPDCCTTFNSVCPFVNLCRANATERATLQEALFAPGEAWRGFRYEDEA